MSDHFTSLANALGLRYRLERTLQSGTAAHVYLAEDRALGRRVAVKVLRDEMAATVNAERFIAEIRVCAQLRHPNIVPVYESGEVDGLPYFVMPFIDGESLRTRLARVGRLPLADTIRITQDVARALDFAHRHHIVHRDIKPENIMLYRGRALVLDFGIALAMDALDAPRRTMPGLTLGTFHYMSPEQAAGESPVDGRSDIYSLACVVYEMLSGRPPFIGPPAAVIRQHLVAQPRPLAAVCPGPYRKIGWVLSRALAKTHVARYDSAGTFLTALVGVAPRTRVVGQRVAVVPFTNLNGCPAVDTFSDSIGEEVAASLQTVDGLAVVAGSSIGDAGSDVHPAEVARWLGADVLLFGGVREIVGEDRVQVSAALIDGRSGGTRWSGMFAGPCRAGLDTQCEPVRHLADAVATALGLKRAASLGEQSFCDAPRCGHHDESSPRSTGHTAAR
jgi:eukaryotic-like serine/threonine-protein kinase